MTAADPPLELTDTTLDDALAGASLPVLLDLWAPWCQPCRALAPVLDEVAAACRGRLRLAKLDVEKFPAVSARLRVRGIPTLLLMKGGVEVARQVGAVSASELKAFLARNGIEAAPATALDAPPADWGAFYGDEGLRGFLLDRLQAFAASGALVRARLPSWEGGHGSVSAALVRHADPRVFERVSGMPFAFACALEFAGLATPAEVDEVLREVPAGASLGRIAWDLLRGWLGDPANDWPAVIGAGSVGGDPVDDDGVEGRAVDELRRRWLALSEAPGPAATPAAAWAALRDEAGRRVGARDPRREVRRSMAQLVEELSPPPASDDAQGWIGALLMRANHLRYAAIVHAHGWSADDLAHDGIRFLWFEARAAAEPEGRLGEARLAALRSEWEAGHESAAYRAKVAERDAHWPQWQATQHRRIRAELVRLLADAAVKVAA